MGLFAGDSLPKTDIGILCAGVVLFFVHRFAFGFGKPQKERRWAIQVYNLGSMVLIAEVGASPRFLSTAWSPLASCCTPSHLVTPLLPHLFAVLPHILDLPRDIGRQLAVR